MIVCNKRRIRGYGKSRESEREEKRIFLRINPIRLNANKPFCLYCRKNSFVSDRKID